MNLRLNSLIYWYLKFMQTRGEKENIILLLQMITYGIVIPICIRANIKHLKCLNITKKKLKINLTEK